MLTGSSLGLNGIRGVADIPDTPFLAVTGSARDAIILDTRTLDIVARFASTTPTRRMWTTRKPDTTNNNKETQP